MDNDEAEVLQAQDADLGTIKMFKVVGDERQSVFYGNEVISRRRLTNWIDKNVPWFVRELNGSHSVFSNEKENYRSLAVLTMYLDYENEEKKHNLISTLETIAESFRERIVFTYMDGYVL